MDRREGILMSVNGGLPLLGEGVAAYQLVGGVTAYQGYDG